MARKDLQHSRLTGQVGPNGVPEIDGFTVEELIGDGGFSQVYRGTQETPGRSVAIKVFRTSGKVGTRVRERFKRESAVIGRLSSEDGLVTVFTGGFTGAGAPYLAMELCEGGSIADRIRSHGPLPVGEVVAVGDRIGSALATVHSQGIVHRDVKPSNILLKADGRALLTDFGLSVVGEMTEAFGEESRLAMTEVYAPPERLNPGEEDGTGVDAAGDQYSFALTLYAMLLGGSPFTGETTTKRALKALQGQIEPLTRADVPPALVEVLRRALTSRPNDRWPSMADFVMSLRSIALPGPTGTASAPSAPSPPSTQGSADPRSQASHRGAASFDAPPAAQAPVPPSGPPGAQLPTVPGLTDDVADAPTSMPGAGPRPPEPMQPPSVAAPSQTLGSPDGPTFGQPQPAAAPPSPHSGPVGSPNGVPGAAFELADDATRMPLRDPGIPVIEAPPAPEVKKNPKRNLYVAGAVVASAFLVVVIAAVVFRGEPDPTPSPDPSVVNGGATSSSEPEVALIPPTIDKVRLTDDGIAFTWDGDPGDQALPVYTVQVDGVESGYVEAITESDSGGWVREQFVNSVTSDDGTVEEVDASQHEYCIVVSLFPSDPDGPELVASEQKCLEK